ncbi:MAG: sigma-70 family RNA polymerase sigma factor [Edaphobacter sp.]|uniref:RNA polymerase sigma factor n=1 Tax=Edaphobacter sp. TaxID=1934404 RepID=UPI002394AAC1|nr:sigma-70 family RNA polymerase sigma factor [Edaphobacter sp.]MDE1175066.1 sigma-70 family RNA polymerase sigma factor [Edaphobacter sp.]
MTPVSIDGLTVPQQDQMLHDALQHNESRLRSFIRRQVGDTGQVEDILQDVFYELIQAYRLMKPIEHVTGWLFRVARNRIVDLFRSPQADSLDTPAFVEDESLSLADLLPSADAGPEAAYARTILLKALEDAIGDLPVEQREVFLAHELEGISFKELSAMTGVGVNTLLSRKRYAVLFLRARLQDIWDLDF